MLDLIIKLTLWFRGGLRCSTALLCIMVSILASINLFAQEESMSAEIVKVYREELPPMRFIGKKYTADDFIDSNIGDKWEEWFHTDNDWFGIIKRQDDSEIAKSIFDKVGETVALWYTTAEGDGSEYWIGTFMPANTPIPNGFTYMDFPASSLGICWVYGTIPHIFGANEMVLKSLKEAGFEITPNEEGKYWTLESYFCPRYTTPDEHGKQILDRSYFVK